MTQEAGTKEAPSGARKFLRILGRVLIGLVVLIGALAAFVYFKSEAGIHARFDTRTEDLVIPTDAESVQRGDRLAHTRGCMDCHASNGAGQQFLDAMPVMIVRTPNLTPAGPTANWTGRDWARAIRHGIRPDGSATLFMPVGDYRMMDDQDLGDVVAYLKSLPPVRNDAGRTVVGPVGRILYLKGELPLVPAELVDHSLRVPQAPEVAPTAEYGRYMANTCTGCHGEHFSGGHIPGTPPDWPPAANITQDRTTGIASMTKEQFVAAITTGTRRAGGTINPMHMPWRQFASFTETEISALWAYLQTVPARTAGTR